MSRVPTGNGVPTRSESRPARRVASGTPRVRIPTNASPARSFWRSAISCAIRSIIRPMRSASRIFAFLRRRASVKSARVYGLDGEEATPDHVCPPFAKRTPRTPVRYNRVQRRGTPMVFYNASTRELTAKIVYYGPGLGGKATNRQVLHRRLDPGTAGELLALSTETDRTIYFDLLPVELGDIKGYRIRFQLATVPGQTAFNETRRIVLKGADGIVFVADSQWTMLPKNLESWQSLKDNLFANGVAVETIPIVIQYNKRDLPDILSVEAMQEALGFSSYAHVEAVASEAHGVTETFKLISKLTFLDLLRRLQGRSPSEAAGAVMAGNPEPAGEPAAPLTESPDRRPPLTLVRSAPETTKTEPARARARGVRAPDGGASPGARRPLRRRGVPRPRRRREPLRGVRTAAGEGRAVGRANVGLRTGSRGAPAHALRESGAGAPGAGRVEAPAGAALRGAGAPRGRRELDGGDRAAPPGAGGVARRPVGESSEGSARLGLLSSSRPPHGRRTLPRLPAPAVWRRRFAHLRRQFRRRPSLPQLTRHALGEIDLHQRLIGSIKPVGQDLQVRQQTLRQPQ